MPDDLTIPLVAAAAFTAGCYLINRLEAYAEVVERALVVALVLIFVFGSAAAFAQLMRDAPDGERTSVTDPVLDLPAGNEVDPHAVLE